MASHQKESREELDKRPDMARLLFLEAGGTRSKSLEAQEHLPEGRRRGGQTRKEQLGTEGYKETGRKGGLSTTDKSGEERAEEEGIEIDESKYMTKY